MGTNNRVRFHP